MLTSAKLYSFFLYLVAILFIPALAENSPVKSIDKSGHVTYSDKPVENAKDVSKITIDPGPSQSEIKAAQQQANQNINTAKKIELENKEEKKQKPAKQASAKEPDNKQNTINSGASNRWPYGAIPRSGAPAARPPGRRPGVNPPPANRPTIGIRHR